VIIDPRYCGPPGMGNGGYVSGLLAAHVDPAGAAEVTLRRPTPLGVELNVKTDGDGKAVLLNGTGLVAEAVTLGLRPEVRSPADGFGVLGSPPPAPVAAAQAREAGRRAGPRVNREQHPFPGCFVCGPDRTPADGGLGIIPGPLAGRDLLADEWRPGEDIAGENGQVRTEFVWAALDCAGGHGAIRPGLPPYVLGRLKVRPLRPVLAGHSYVVVGWLLAIGGRKIAAGSVMYNSSGKAAAVALGTWLPLPGATPLPVAPGEAVPASQAPADAATGAGAPARDAAAG
jgi:hypothetical protein